MDSAKHGLICWFNSAENAERRRAHTAPKSRAAAAVELLAFLGYQAQATVQEIAEEYARETGYTPYIFSGSSPGAVEFGTLRLRPVS